MRCSQNKYKKYKKVNTRFPADPWKVTYFPERNDLGYLKLANGAMCSPEVLHIDKDISGGIGSQNFFLY